MTSRVLYVAYRVPHPPDKGERIRAFHQIRHLAIHGSVHLVCPVRRGDSERSLERLAAICASVEWVPDSALRSAAREARCFARGLPRSLGTHQPAGLARAVDRVLAAREVDVVVASTLYAAEAVRAVRGIPRVIDLMDVVSDLWRARSEQGGAPRAWLDRIEARRLARYEARLAAEMERIVLVSRAEAELFQRVTAAAAPVPDVVGNGVDLDAFAPPEHPAAAPLIVFTGSMDYFPNVDAVCFFCTEVLPRVREAVPEAGFRIVGRDPAPAVRALARRAGVIVTGTVEDVRPHLREAAIAVAPFRRARGVQNKILEALAMGLPVVASPVSLAGLDSADCEALLSAEAADDFANVVIGLLRDPARRARLGQAARGFVERRYRWEDQGERLRAVLAAAVDTGARPERGARRTAR